MNIEELLEQYFEGRTSAEEEATLRRFFTSSDVPDNLAMYKPLFVYFDDEIKKMHISSVKESRSTFSKIRYSGLLWLSGAAACAAILVGVFFTNQQSNKCSGEGDYVIIDGRCYTDAKTIRSATLNTLREMSEDDDDLAEDDAPVGAKRIMENQLKEFGSLFDE